MKPHIFFAFVILVFMGVETNSVESRPEIVPAIINDALNFTATITAYSSTRRQTSSHPKITASGKHVRDGFIACPRKFPFGTKVTIDGRVYECQDRLNLKYDSRFDIWKPNTRAARIFGKRTLPVAVMEPPIATADEVE